MSSLDHLHSWDILPRLGAAAYACAAHYGGHLVPVEIHLHVVLGESDPAPGLGVGDLAAGHYSVKRSGADSQKRTDSGFVEQVHLGLLK